MNDGHTTHVVSGAKLLPNGVNGTTPNLKPVPKPRRPRVPRKDVNSEGRTETTDVPNSAHHQQTGDSEVTNNAKITSRLGSEDLGSEETSRPDGVQTSPVISRIEEWNGLHKGEGVTSQGEGGGNSRPNRPHHVTRHVTGNKITSSSDLDQSSMSENIAKLRLRANSIDEVEAGVRGRSMDSTSETGTEERTWSIGSAGITSPGHTKNMHVAPMVRMSGALDEHLCIRLV